jgi:hypothetical protein
MSNMILITGVYMLIIFTGIKLFGLIKRFSRNKDRFSRLFEFPKSLDRSDDVVVIFGQLIALSWIIIGIVLKIASY